MSWNHWGTELIDIELIACETAAACILSSRCCRKFVCLKIVLQLLVVDCAATNRFGRLCCPDCGVLNVIGLFQIFHVHLCNIHMCCLHQMKYRVSGAFYYTGFRKMQLYSYSERQD